MTMIIFCFLFQETRLCNITDKNDIIRNVMKSLAIEWRTISWQGTNAKSSFVGSLKIIRKAIRDISGETFQNAHKTSVIPKSRVFYDIRKSAWIENACVPKTKTNHFEYSNKTIRNSVHVEANLNTLAVKRNLTAINWIYIYIFIWLIEEAIFIEILK